MVRKLALAVSLALGTLSVPAHALGLGELSSKSALNQNFNGDITLLSVAPEELDSVRVKLADADAFARAGVERPFYLSLLKFEPTLTSRGRAVIRVTSEFPIREPFMNFLVEVNWPNGRLLREYTVLLDPPTTTTRRPPSVAPAAQSRQLAAPAPAPAQVRATPAPAAMAAATGESEYGPVKANETAWSIAKNVRPQGVSMEQMMMALLNANPQAFVDGNINRLRRGQILRVPAISEIQQLTRQQAREAYRAQQDAWLARRNERLQEAAAETAAQEAPPAGPEPAAQSDDQLRIATARPDGEGEPGAGDDDAAATTANDLKSRLIVARENAETSRQEAETLRSQVDDLQERLADMQKLLSLKDDQLAQLQDRMAAEPEAPVVEPAEAAEAAPPAPAPGETEPADVVMANQPEPAGEPVSDDAQATAEVAGDVARYDWVPDEDYRIADIPPQVNPDRIVERGGVDEAPEPAMSGPVDAGPVADTAGGQMAEPVSEPPASAAPEVVIETAPAGDASVAGAAAEAPMAAADSEPAAVPAQVAETEPAVASPEPPVSKPLIPPALVSVVEKNIVPIGLGAIAVLGLLGWVATRGRGGKQKDDLELATAGAGAGAATAVAAADEPAVDAPAYDAESLSDLPDSALLDDFSPSEINALQDETGEVDPVSEADVYIAYGRYQQAEELLRQAMERDPDRLALKHKLLEVHYATRNTAGYVALAQQMVDAGQDAVDENAWARAQDMGRELDPDNPLFSLKEGASPVTLAGLGGAAAGAAALDDDTLSLNDLELSQLTSAYEESASEIHNLEAPSEVSILLDPEPSMDSDEETRTGDMPESISLDELDSLEFEMPASESSTVVAGDSESDDLITDSFDLDSMMQEAEAAVDADDSTLSLDSAFSADELQAQLDELSDLSVLDTQLDEPAEVADLEPSGNLGLEMEDTGRGDEGALDQPISLDEAFDADELDAGELELVDTASAGGGEDDVTTKLDLARAYVEMGDQDGARSILEEVVAEGNDSQRGDAEKLLAQIG